MSAFGVQIADNIREAATSQGVPRDALEKAAGLSANAFAARMANPDGYYLGELRGIADVLGVGLQELLTETAA